MNSYILQLASKYVVGLLILFGIIALFRGHNYPGGGFIGGLLVGLAIAYKGFAFDPEYAVAQLRLKPETYIALGLATILLSTLPSIFAGMEAMTGMWVSVDLFGFDLKIGTPTVFDIGVFFVVIGVSLLFIFSSVIE